MTKSNAISTSAHVDRSIAFIIGILFLFSIVMSFVGSGMIESCMKAKDVLGEMPKNSIGLKIGVLMEIAMNASLVSIAFLLLPILNKYNEKLAYGYLSLRIVEVAIVLIGTLSVLSLIPLSQQFIKSGITGESYYQNVALLLTSCYFKARYISMIFIVLSGVFLSYVLYLSKLVPRPISITGLIGYGILLLISPLLVTDVVNFNNAVMLSLMPFALF